MTETANLSQLNNQRGAVGLEFTIIFPLLLMVTFGIIEFGILMFDKAIVTGAAREAARAAIVYDYDGPYEPLTCDDVAIIRTGVEDVADRYMGDNLGNGNYFLVRFNSENPNTVILPPLLIDDEYVLPVRVEYTFNFIFIDTIINVLFNGTFRNDILLRAEIKMRGEDQRLLEDWPDCGT